LGLPQLKFFLWYIYFYYIFVNFHSSLITCYHIFDLDKTYLNFSLRIKFSWNYILEVIGNAAFSNQTITFLNNRKHDSLSESLHYQREFCHENINLCLKTMAFFNCSKPSRKQCLSFATMSEASY
jgi:hypothetical protein